jgi:hypothetical protein
VYQKILRGQVVFDSSRGHVQAVLVETLCSALAVNLPRFDVALHRYGDKCGRGLSARGSR